MVGNIAMSGNFAISQATGGLLCDPTTGTGVPPASLAEWTLSGTGNMDFYDSMVVVAKSKCRR